MDTLPIDFLLSAVLFLIMFSIGATLRFADFRRIFWRPKSLGLGLFLQMLFLPLLVFSILYLVDLRPEYKIGFVIVALCPGGTTSNFISYLVNADVALSISLTTINSFLILLSIPFGVNLALDYYAGAHNTISLPFIDTLLSVFSIVLLPAFLGLCFNHFFSDLSRRIRRALKVVNVALLGLVYAVKFVGGGESSQAVSLMDLAALLPVALILQLLSMIVAYLISTYFLKRTTSCLTIGIEVGLQNTALALFIATVLLSNETFGKPALVYAMFSFFTTLLFAWLIFVFVIRKERRKHLGTSDSS